MLDVQTNQESYLVVDTSFLFDMALEELWALRVKRSIQENVTHVIVPSGVEYEYDKRSLEGKTDDYGVLIPPDSIEDLIWKKKISIYSKTLNRSLSESLDEKTETFYKTPRPLSGKSRPISLSKTDKSVIQATLDHARGGKRIAVASADYDIASQIDSRCDVENLEIQNSSPWSMPTEEGFSPLDIKFLVTGNVFGELLKSNSNDNRSRFLGIAKQMHIGGGIHYDIAFGLYTKKLVFKPLPKIDGVEFLPLMFIVLNESGESTKEYARYGFFNKYSSLVGYSAQIPTVVDFAEQKPMTYLEIENLRTRFKNHELKSEDLLKSINLGEVYVYNSGGRQLSVQKVKSLNWARIEDWHINIFDKLSVGKLQDLRNKIKTYQQ